MEQSISALAFRGSIIEAITEAKRQKKLFVVYISGESEDSVSMDKSTWSESSVAESISKYCILLHILEGSTEAAQFSALYPQKSAPCITAIGYNGVQLWQNEGFVSAEVLVSTLEKAWLSIHVQETTATFLTAALASRQSEQIPSEVPPTVSREIGSSSSETSTNTNASVSVGKKDDHGKVKDENHAPLVEERNSKLDDNVSRGPIIDKPEESEVKHPGGPIIDKPEESKVKQTGGPIIDKPEESKVKQPDSTSKPVNQVAITSSDSVVGQRSSVNVNRQVAKPAKAESLQTEKVDDFDLASTKSTDIYLNIRLPGGASLQEKFEPTSTLRMVKDYVDEKQESSIGSYDLAIPYPRKVFGNQDLNKTLTELNLLDRQALIVVPHLQASGLPKGKPSMPISSVSTTANGSSDGESYFSLVKRYLSYVNPLVYLGGAGDPNSSTSVPETRRVLPQSGTPQGNFTGSRRSYLVTSNHSSNTPSTSKSNKPDSSRFGSGSNIHTLKHDEDDTQFSGKNAFWNGNSTEYGGDGDNK